MRLSFSAVALLAALSLPSLAKADSFKFTLTSGSGDDIITFTVDPVADANGHYPDPYPVNFYFKSNVSETYMGGSPQGRGDGVVFGDFSDQSTIDQTLGYGEAYWASSTQFFDPTTLAITPTTTPLTVYFGRDPEEPYSLTITEGPSVAATPEPSSIALLGTGVLGVAGAVRRRFVRR